MTTLRDFLAYWLVMVIPGHRGGLWTRLQLALLPYAGCWAYRDHDDGGES